MRRCKAASCRASLDRRHSRRVQRLRPGWAAKLDGSTLQELDPLSARALSHLHAARPPVSSPPSPELPLAIALWKVACAAAGCTVVLKPAPETPLTACVWRLAVQAGPAAGALNVLLRRRDRRRACSHPGIDKISFAALPTGRAISRTAVERMARFTLELGGKSPMIVLADADPDAAAAAGAAMGISSTRGRCAARFGLRAPQPVRPRRAEVARQAEAARLRLRCRVAAWPGGLRRQF